MPMVLMVLLLGSEERSAEVNDSWLLLSCIPGSRKIGILPELRSVVRPSTSSENEESREERDARALRAS